MTISPDTSKSNNPHLTDPILTPFLAPSFSPIAYLNSTLPSSSPSPSTSTTSSSTGPRTSAPSHSSSSSSTTSAPVPLSTLATQTQSHIAALTAQTARLSATLTALTDEILRTGARLAYEVELLRGDAVALTEAVGVGKDGVNGDGEGNGGLRDAIGRFTGGKDGGKDGEKGVDGDGFAVKSTATESRGEDTGSGSTATAAAAPPASNTEPPPTPAAASKKETTAHLSNEPPSLPHLRTLLHVRSHLQATIAIFNTALSFPLPPPPPPSISLPSTSHPSLPLTSTIPDLPPTSANTSSNKADSTAEAEKELEAIRTEIQTLLHAGEVTRARERVDEWKAVCGVWRGTAEEKGRRMWVEDVLVKGLDLGEGEGEGVGGDESGRERDGGGGVGRLGTGTGIVTGGKAGGEVRQVHGQGQGKGESQGWMRRLRDEIYAE